MNKFTQGDWGVLKLGKDHFQVTAPGQLDRYKNDRVALAEVRNWDGEPLSGQSEFNAKLMAAAPEMLQAIETALDACYPRLSPDQMEAIGEPLERALAKARGQTYEQFREELRKEYDAARARSE